MSENKHLRFYHPFLKKKNKEKKIKTKTKNYTDIW